MASTPTSNASGTMTALIPLAYNATATARRGWSQAQTYQSFNIASYQSLLQGGENVLAIQGLMYSSSDPDFYVLPELQYGSFNINNIEYFTTPTPGATNVPGDLGSVSDTISASPTASTLRPSTPRSPARQAQRSSTPWTAALPSSQLSATPRRSAA